MSDRGGRGGGRRGTGGNRGYDNHGGQRGRGGNRGNSSQQQYRGNQDNFGRGGRNGQQQSRGGGRGFQPQQQGVGRDFQQNVGGQQGFGSEQSQRGRGRGRDDGGFREHDDRRGGGRGRGDGRGGDRRGFGDGGRGDRRGGRRAQRGGRGGYLSSDFGSGQRRVLAQLCTEAINDNNIPDIRPDPSNRSNERFQYANEDKFSVQNVLSGYPFVELSKSRPSDYVPVNQNNRLYTNYFTLSQNNIGLVHQYDVTFEEQGFFGRKRDDTKKLTSSFGKMKLESSEQHVPAPDPDSAEMSPQHGTTQTAVAKLGGVGIVEQKDDLSKNLRRMFMTEFINKMYKEFQVQNPQSIVFDGGKSIYCHKGATDLQLQSEVSCGRKRCHISCRFVATVDMGLLWKEMSKQSGSSIGKGMTEQSMKVFDDSKQSMIQALDVMLRHSMCEMYKCFGRSYYYLEPDTHYISLGRDQEFGLIKGFFANVRMFFSTVAINLDVANGLFRVQCYVAEFLSKKGLDPNRLLQDNNQFARALDMLKNTRVKLTQFSNPRHTKITNLLRKSPYDQTFELNTPDGQTRTISVAQYFLETYNINCNRNLPIVIGTKETSYFPMDVCFIPFTRIINDEGDSAKADMIRYTALTPDKRYEIIMEKLNECLPKGRNEFLDAWGLRTAPEMSTVNFSILPPPQIFAKDQAGNIRALQRPHAVTGLFQVQGRYFQPASSSSGAYQALAINMGEMCDSGEAQGFIKALCDESRRRGINIQMQGPVVDASSADLYKVLRHFLITSQPCNISLIFIVLPSSGSTDCYAFVKSLCEMTFGFVSQCIKDSFVKKWHRKCDTRDLINLSHKINAKLGGINVSLIQSAQPNDVFDVSRGMLGNTMLVGIDVTHGGGSTRLSIASVVASMDSYPHLYELQISGQKHPKTTRSSIETVVNIREMMVNLLKRYYDRNQKYPSRLIVYRDGVSEGQFSIVLNYELVEIKRALDDVMKTSGRAKTKNIPKPTITYLIVQKRHHTRFFPDQGNNTTKNGNVVVGTFVDAGICSDRRFDFFLCSHEGIQGTSIPTYYRVLVDENNMTRSQIAQLSYNLCYTYIRCSRSVSIPSPCYYAHLAAFRARHYAQVFSMVDEGFKAFINENEVDTKKEKAGRGPGRKSSSESNIQKFKVVTISVKSEVAKTMFFV